MSVAELLLDIPSGGGASLALLGASAFMALTELGLDLMIDYYNGPPPVPMGENMRSSVRAAANGCAALIERSRWKISTPLVRSREAQKTLDCKSRPSKDRQPPRPSKNLDAFWLASQLANNQLGEAELYPHPGG